MTSIIGIKKIQQRFQEENSLDFLNWLTANLSFIPKEVECIRDSKLIDEVVQESLSSLAFTPAFKMFSNLTIKSAHSNNWLILNTTFRNQRHVFYSIAKDVESSFNFEEELKLSTEDEFVQTEIYSFIKMNWVETFPNLSMPQVYFLTEQFNNLYWTCLRITGKFNATTEELFDQHRIGLSNVAKKHYLSK